MAGLWPFGRGRRARTAAGEAPRRASHPAVLKREQRALLREREERVRDLGGLVFEMFRRDRFRVELVTERCADLVAVDQRLEELDSLLSASRRGLRCACGAPLAWGAHFCANCGRAVGSRPVVACARCGTPLPADVKFCGNCGSAVEIPRQEEPPADTQPEPATKEPAEV
jgi:predicted amidophosphoribosyltransferase